VAGIERQLGGIVDFDWQAGGLCCTLSLPHDPTNESSKRLLGRQVDGEETQFIATNSDDKRVLLVEDEPLVSMMLADMLSAFGHKVDGPYSRFSDAMLAAKSNNLQAGILDVNLGGEKTYAVADILTDRKIPFAFVTGYGPTVSFPHLPTRLCCKNRSRPQSCTHCCSRSCDKPQSCGMPACRQECADPFLAERLRQWQSALAKTKPGNLRVPISLRNSLQSGMLMRNCWRC